MTDMKKWSILGVIVVIFIMGCKKDETLDNDHMVQWVFVKGGTFIMGNTSGETVQTDQKSEYKVTLSDFYISKFEITNSQFADFLNEYKSDKIKAGVNAGQIMCWEHSWGIEKIDSTWVPVPGYENYPMLNVSWFGANEYCSFNGWRLITEAEWEFSARGGSLSKGYKYSGSDSVDLVAWYEPDYEGRPGTNSHPIGQKQPNELGIYDMSGNVWEWVSDIYGEYPEGSFTNPTGLETGKKHVYRGGSWLSTKEYCTIVGRSMEGTDYHGVTHNGIRCVKTDQ